MQTPSHLSEALTHLLVAARRSENPKTKLTHIVPIDRIYNRSDSIKSILIILDVLLQSFRVKLKVQFDGQYLMADHSSQIICKRLIKAAISRDFRPYSPSPWDVARSIFRGYRLLAQASRELPSLTAYQFRLCRRFFRAYIYADAMVESVAGRSRTLLLGRSYDAGRLAVGCAAANHNFEIYAWNVNLVGGLDMLPFPATREFCWTRDQCRKIEEAGGTPVQMAIQKLSARAAGLQGPLTTSRVGLLLNSGADLQEAVSFSETLLTHHKLGEIFIRPHPNAAGISKKLPSRIKLSDWRMPLEDYLNQIDIAICMTSNVIIECLLFGKAVLATPLLDKRNEDLDKLISGTTIPIYYSTRDNPISVLTRFYGDGGTAFKTSGSYTVDDAGEIKALSELFKT